jgi:hypothetical protein
MALRVIKRLLFILCATVLCFCSRLTHAQVLNIDYTAHLNPAFSTKTGPAAIGAPDDFWNVYSRDTTNISHWRANGTVSDLKWADGSSSGATLSVTNAMGAWLSTGTDAMLMSYLYPFGSGPITSTLEGLPSHKYDIYVYAHGQPDAENAVISLKVDGVTIDTNSTSSLPGWNTAEWIEGNQFVVFYGIELDTNSVVQITSSGGKSGMAVINGIQLQANDSDLHIVTQPVSTNVTAGAPVTFSVAAKGSGTLTYQWLRNGAQITGATSTELTIARATGADQGAYRVRVQNGTGAIVSAPAILTVDTLGIVAPAITNQPVGGTFFAGDHVTLSVTATGSDLEYQWKKNNTVLEGKNSDTLDIESFSATDVGSYTVTVSNLAGSKTSARAALAIAARASGPVLNVDYTAHLNPNFRTKTGPAAIGVSSNDFWNVYSRDVTDLWDWQEGGSVSNLKWTDGSFSGVTLSVTNAQGAWFTFSADPMMESYLYPLGRSGELVSTLADLPAQKYDIYVYAHGQPDSENAEIALNVGGTNIATRSTSSLPGWAGPAWVDGNQFVLFSEVEVAAGQNVQIISRGGVSTLPVINGLQVVGPTSMFTGAQRGNKPQSVVFSVSGVPKLRLQGRADARYTIYVSNDLATWTELGTFRAANGLLDIVDSAAGENGSRYYRAVLVD